MSTEVEVLTQRLAALTGVDAETLVARALMGRLVEEYYPADQIIWRAGRDAWTGAEMAALIRSGHAIGVDYAHSILRVCRDLLARQANRS